MALDRGYSLQARSYFRLSLVKRETSNLSSVEIKLVRSHLRGNKPGKFV